MSCQSQRPVAKREGCAPQVAAVLKGCSMANRVASSAPNRFTSLELGWQFMRSLCTQKCALYTRS